MKYEKRAFNVFKKKGEKECIVVLSSLRVEEKVIWRNNQSITFCVPGMKEKNY